MKAFKILTVISIIAFFSISTILAQGFVPPSEGKSVVYFARISKMGYAINFKYFDNDKFIGKFKGKNYMRYECTPGEHLFWASSEKKAFITADLKEGETYIVIVEPRMGAWSAAVRLHNTEDKKLLKKAIEIINSNRPIITEQSIIDEENIVLKEYIAEKLDFNENKLKAKNNYPHISADMAITADKMK